MSIGIAVAFENAVLLVADGRRSNAFEVVTDDAKKIVEINALQAAIEFGAVMASAPVVEQMKTREQPIGGGDTIEFLTRVVYEAGADLIAKIAPGSSDRTIKVGIVVGGFDLEGPYVGGVIYGQDMTEPSKTLDRPSPMPQYIVLGGEDCGAREYFSSELERAYRFSAGDQASFMSMAKRAAKKTVRYASSNDKTIGGRVQFWMLERGGQSQTGFL